MSMDMSLFCLPLLCSLQLSATVTIIITSVNLQAANVHCAQKRDRLLSPSYILFMIHRIEKQV